MQIRPYVAHYVESARVWIIDRSFVISNPARPTTKPCTSSSDAYSTAFFSFTDPVYVNLHCLEASTLTRLAIYFRR